MSFWGLARASLHFGIFLTFPTMKSKCPFHFSGQHPALKQMRRGVPVTPARLRAGTGSRGDAGSWTAEAPRRPGAKGAAPLPRSPAGLEAWALKRPTPGNARAQTCHGVLRRRPCSLMARSCPGPRRGGRGSL